MPGQRGPPSLRLSDIEIPKILLLMPEEDIFPRQSCGMVDVVARLLALHGPGDAKTVQERVLTVHRPKPRGYEALDIYLRTKQSEADALKAKQWSDKQQKHLADFKDYDTVNRFEFTRNGKQQMRFRDKKTGRLVKGY